MVSRAQRTGNPQMISDKCINFDRIPKSRIRDITHFPFITINVLQTLIYSILHSFLCHFKEEKVVYYEFRVVI